MLTAKVHVTLKPGVLDPQGRAIQSSLAHLGFASVAGVRQGKYFEVQLQEHDPDAARATMDAMCRDLLANMVIENYAIEIVS